jgi:hypothetical protein
MLRIYDGFIFHKSSRTAIKTRRLRIFHSYFWCVETQILPLSVSPWQSLREISRLYKVFGLSNFINRAVLGQL